MRNVKALYLIPVLVLFGIWFFWPERSTNKQRQLEEQARRAALSANPASPEHREFLEQNRRLFAEEGMYSFEQLMELARTGRISLVGELWQLRRKCGVTGIRPEDQEAPAQQPLMNLEECNIRIENFLRSHYPPPGNEKLVSLFRNYLRYEDAMRQMRIPEGLSPQERFEFIRKKRREFFSEEDAKLIFGFEETRFTTQQALLEFVRNSTGMPADLRVKKYYELRKNLLGDYHSAVAELEPTYTRYETELMLRSDEMQRKGTTEKETQALRERYFGTAAAQRMAQVEQQIRAERERIAAYEAAARQFEKENPHLSEKERNAQLAALREKMLGKEEAEAYARRMQYEEYLRTNNLK
ncbi:MAG: lipase chaperone [Turneriella sp.]|nr:lipase chaperone [Turneriella sp.]